MEGHGERLLRFLGAARGEVVLVAPFMKLPVVQRCLEVIDERVPVRCYTRWELADVTAGASDPEIAALPRLNGVVRLVTGLHAKAYVVDDRALVGSANLTSTALGLGVAAANVELLTEVPRTADDVAVLLREIEENSVDATIGFAEALRDRANLANGPDADSVPLKSGEVFYPLGRRPEKLMSIYGGAPPASASDVDLQADLLRLRLPPGLVAADVRHHVRQVLQGHPDLKALFDGQPLPQSSVAGVIAERLAIAEEAAARRAETLALWLTEFAGVRSQATDWDLVVGKEFG